MATAGHRLPLGCRLSDLAARGQATRFKPVVRILRETSPVYMVISRTSPGHLPENSDQA